MDHYFTNNNIKSNIKIINSIINEKQYDFFVDNGVFSKNNVDYGTKLLLENIKEIDGKILDVGCGYGVIGIYLKMNYNCAVDMIDINKRAIHLSRKNIDKYKLNDITVFESDAYINVTNKYDYIITNPPIRAGKEKVLEILIGAKEFLNENGKLYFVIRKDQGAKSITEHLKAYYNLNILTKSKGFWIICAEN